MPSSSAVHSLAQSAHLNLQPPFEQVSRLRLWWYWLSLDLWRCVPARELSDPRLWQANQVRFRVMSNVLCWMIMGLTKDMWLPWQNQLWIYLVAFNCHPIKELFEAFRPKEHYYMEKALWSRGLFLLCQYPIFIHLVLRAWQGYLIHLLVFVGSLLLAFWYGKQPLSAEAPKRPLYKRRRTSMDDDQQRQGALTGQLQQATAQVSAPDDQQLPLSHVRDVNDRFFRPMITQVTLYMLFILFAISPLHLPDLHVLHDCIEIWEATKSTAEYLTSTGPEGVQVTRISIPGLLVHAVVGSAWLRWLLFVFLYSLYYLSFTRAIAGEMYRFELSDKLRTFVHRAAFTTEGWEAPRPQAERRERAEAVHDVVDDADNEMTLLLDGGR